MSPAELNTHEPLPNWPSRDADEESIGRCFVIYNTSTSLALDSPEYNR